MVLTKPALSEACSSFQEVPCLGGEVDCVSDGGEEDESLGEVELEPRDEEDDCVYIRDVRR